MYRAGRRRRSIPSRFRIRKNRLKNSHEVTTAADDLYAFDLTCLPIASDLELLVRVSVSLRQQMVKVVIFVAPQTTRSYLYKHNLTYNRNRGGLRVHLSLVLRHTLSLSSGYILSKLYNVLNFCMSSETKQQQKKNT